jgi:hypothetical protein
MICVHGVIADGMLFGDEFVRVAASLDNLKKKRKNFSRAAPRRERQAAAKMKDEE